MRHFRKKKQINLRSIWKSVPGVRRFSQRRYFSREQSGPRMDTVLSTWNNNYGMVGFVACYQVFEGAMSGKSRIESACSLSWFANWKPEQKVEFAKVLVRLENPQRSVYYTNTYLWRICAIYDYHSFAVFTGFHSLSRLEGNPWIVVVGETLGPIRFN